MQCYSSFCSIFSFAILTSVTILTTHAFDHSREANIAQKTNYFDRNTKRTKDCNDLSSTKSDECGNGFLLQQIDYQTRPKIGFSLGYNLTLIQTDGKEYTQTELVNKGLGSQALVEMWYKIFDKKYFLLGAKFGTGISQIHGYNASTIIDTIYNNSSFAAVIFYGQLMVGLNITPSFNVYLTAGAGGTLVDYAMEKHAIVGAGMEWRMHNRLGAKIEYSCLINTFDHILFGIPAFHTFSFGLNLYIL